MINLNDIAKKALAVIEITIEGEKSTFTKSFSLSANALRIYDNHESMKQKKLMKAMGNISTDTTDLTNLEMPADMLFEITTVSIATAKELVGSIKELSTKEILDFVKSEFGNNPQIDYITEQVIIEIYNQISIKMQEIVEPQSEETPS